MIAGHQIQIADPVADSKDIKPPNPVLCAQTSDLRAVRGEARIHTDTLAASTAQVQSALSISRLNRDDEPQQ